ncbi:cell division protein FtsL [Dendrosporobacter sp. 1207_IL3150]|uniref:cell division protein FtsL n=1 Tax=Dendrosporobacter sp. 1207_IL3150 TaxID=3084054 RepID=UPI002FD9F7E5
MLVSKKQEWEMYQQETAPVPTVAKPSVNRALRTRCLIIAALITMIAMFVTVRSEAIIRAGYDLVQVKAMLIKAEKENELLRLDIAKLKSPQRIQEIATRELGMVVPTNVYCAANASETTMASAVTVNENGLLDNLVSAIKSGKAEASKVR